VKWTASRVFGAAAVASVIALVAFALRFNALGGTLGGFDNDHFVHLLRTDMLLNGEQPLRDFADAELRGAWPSLGYAVSAWAQQWWGRTLLAEAYLTVGALALTAAGVFLLALHLSQRWTVALLAAACVMASHPKLYNYEKVLVLLVGAGLVRLWLLRPSWRWLALLAVWTAIAALFRHDFGVYVGIATAVALLARGPAPAVRRVGRLAGYAGLTLVLLLPSIVWVQRYAGLAAYAQQTLESIRGESERTALVWPRLAMDAGWSGDTLAAIAYYTFWLAIAVGAAAIASLTIRRDVKPPAAATGAALLAMAVVVSSFFLRGNLFARFGDAIVPVVLLAAWTVGVAGVQHQEVKGHRSQVKAGSGAWPWRVVPQALMAVIVVALFVGNEMRVELEAAGLSHSWERTQKRFEAAKGELLRLPPQVWEGGTYGTMTASRYLADCTQPTDRVLLATYAPEIPVLARRLVAAGQGTFGLTFYESEAQQRAAVARLERQSVPVVIGAYEDFQGEFADDYRYVYQYVAAHYRDAGVIPVDGRPRFRVLVSSSREPRGVDPQFGLPCFK
jgi:hypothetical protein